MFNCFIGSAPGLFAVFGVNELQKSLDGGFAVSWFETEEMPEHFGPQRFSRGQVPLPGGDSGRVLSALQSTLAFAERVLGLFTFGSVAEVNGETGGRRVHAHVDPAIDDWRQSLEVNGPAFI